MFSYFYLLHFNSEPYGSCVECVLRHYVESWPKLFILTSETRELRWVKYDELKYSLSLTGIVPILDSYKWNGWTCGWLKIMYGAFFLISLKKVYETAYFL